MAKNGFQYFIFFTQPLYRQKRCSYNSSVPGEFFTSCLRKIVRKLNTSQFVSPVPFFKKKLKIDKQSFNHQCYCLVNILNSHSFHTVMAGMLATYSAMIVTLTRCILLYIQKTLVPSSSYTLNLMYEDK